MVPHDEGHIDASRVERAPRIGEEEVTARRPELAAARHGVAGAVKLLHPTFNVRAVAVEQENSHLPLAVVIDWYIQPPQLDRRGAVGGRTGAKVPVITAARLYPERV
jgi:hypothetical protein